MIYILTGSPGAGKTLSAMEWMERIQRETPGRRIYAANVDGLTLPGVLPLDDDGVLSWHQSCEKDSIIFVDEAQRYWRAQRSGEPSAAIIEMETHRHDGIDIVLMTQHPTFLHANIRKLANVHIHLIAFSKSSALRYEWRECHDDIQDSSLRQNGEFKEWPYPTRLYQFYKSASLHTKTAKRPWKMVLARWTLRVLAVVAVVVLGVVGWRIYHGGKVIDEARAGGISSSSPRAASPSGRRVTSDMTPAEYVELQRPRVPTQPWSAPLYDGQSVTQHPQVWCIAVVPPGGCRCITEQGTRYTMPDADCRTLAAGGSAYDPYKREDRSRPAVSHAEPRRSDESAAPALVGIPAPAGQPVGVAPAAYVPPQYGEWNADAFGK